MKTCSIIAIIFASVIQAFGQAPSVEEQLNDFWKQKKHSDIQTLLDARTALTPPDVVALYCSKFFYIFILPDKTKALQAATKLKRVADATYNAGFIQLAAQGLAEVQSIPEIEFGATGADALDGLHTESPNKFPTVDFAVGLRRYLKP